MEESKGSKPQPLPTESEVLAFKAVDEKNREIANLSPRKTFYLQI